MKGFRRLKGQKEMPKLVAALATQDQQLGFGTASVEKIAAAAVEAFGPIDIAPLVVFLSGPDSGYMTGNTISVDGGVAMVV